MDRMKDKNIDNSFLSCSAWFIDEPTMTLEQQAAY
jgi:hypothetical protein